MREEDTVPPASSALDHSEALALSVNTAILFIKACLSRLVSSKLTMTFCCPVFFFCSNTAAAVECFLPQILSERGLCALLYGATVCADVASTKPRTKRECQLYSGDRNPQTQCVPQTTQRCVNIKPSKAQHIHLLSILLF